MPRQIGPGHWIRAAWIAGACSLAHTLGAAAATGFDVCSVIPSPALESVQGAPLLETKSSERQTGGLTIAQCYYVLPNQAQSVSLEVTLPGSDAASRAHPRDYWRRLFDRDRETSETRGRPPQVRGLGSAAFWEGNGPVGALYVLQGDRFLRISIGGSADPTLRVERSKALARVALRGLAKLGKLDHESSERDLAVNTPERRREDR